MATRVIDLDLRRIPDTIEGVGGYDRVMVLFRLDGVPVGRSFIEVKGDRVESEELRSRVGALANMELWEEWVARAIGPDSASPARTATVAVCSRDRPEDLERCIGSLLECIDPRHEILVVDNAPGTDASRRILSGHHERIRYVLEPYPGLNRARNRALQEARHEVVAFVDDDAVVDPGWLEALLRNFDHPLVACVTGLTMPLELESRAQELFETHNSFSRGFQRKVFDRRLGVARAGKAGAGASMALRKPLPDRVGWFDEALDAGTSTHSGGDNEMFSRILSRGYRIVYDPAALSWHRHRRDPTELRRVCHGYAVGVYAFWTRLLVVDRELSVVPAAAKWFVSHHVGNVLRALLRSSGSLPLGASLAGMLGAIVGPWAYLRSRASRRALPPLGEGCPRQALRG